jgi:hypothetical protein
MTLLLPTPTFKPYRIFSSGWGVQSVAALVLQAQGKLSKPYDAFVFANVGEDSEYEGTLKYYREQVIPYAAANNIAIVERQKTYKGKLDSVYKSVMRDDKSIDIPIVFPGRGFGNRSCTNDFKIVVVQKYARETKVSHVELGIGFTTDEQYRVLKKYPGWHDRYWRRDKSGQWVCWTTRKDGTRKYSPLLGYWQRYDFPLIELGLNRLNCAAIIEAAGLPLPPKSACWFCPFTARAVWIERKKFEPAVFEKAIQFQEDVNAKYQRIRGTHPKASARVAIHRDGIPLQQVPDQVGLWDQYMDTDEECETGYCGV